jgi:hypothetical protein
MRGLLASLVVIAHGLLGAAPARADAAAIAGRWSAETTSGRVELLVEPAGRAVTLRLRLGGRPLFDASFAPTERAGVFEAAATGLFAMLGSRRAPANPLEGEELVWARELPAGLAVSRLAIDAGKPVIERARLERVGERIGLRLERLEGERMRIELEAELARGAR